MKYQSLGQILISKKLINQSNLDFCLAVQKADPAGRKIGHYIVNYNFACERDIAQALADASGYKYFNGDFIPNMDIVKKVTVQFLVDKKVFPLLTEGKTTFVLSDVYNTDATDYHTGQGWCRCGVFCCR